MKLVDEIGELLKMEIASVRANLLPMVVLWGLAGAAVAAPDAMRTPALGDVRLEGWLGKKMDRFIAQRLTDPFQRKEVFDEARQAFVQRDDDEAKVGGVWRGEFWGKQMLGSARVADYLRDPEFLGFIREECHRLMKCQDPDGYLGSYADKTFVKIHDVEACRKKFGWLPNWNLWNRKYCIWGMFMAYKATVKGEIVKEAMDTKKGAVIDLLGGSQGTARPTITTAPTNVGLFYQFREGCPRR